MRAPDSQKYQSRKKGSKSSRPAIERPHSGGVVWRIGYR